MTKQDFVRVVGGRKLYYDRQSDQYGKVHDDHILKPKKARKPINIKGVKTYCAARISNSYPLYFIIQA